MSAENATAVHAVEAVVDSVDVRVERAILHVAILRAVVSAGVPVKSAVLVEARARAAADVMTLAVRIQRLPEQAAVTAVLARMTLAVVASLADVALTKAAAEILAAPHARSSQEAFRAAPTKKRETHLFTRSPARENKSQSHV